MQLQDLCLNGSSKPGGEAGVMLRELTLGTSARGCSPRPHCSQVTQHSPACAETRTAAAAACAPADTSHNQHTVRHPCIPPAQAVSRGQVPELPVLGRRGQSVPLARDSWRGSHQVLCSLLKQTEGGDLTLHIAWLCNGMRTNCL